MYFDILKRLNNDNGYIDILPWLIKKKYKDEAVYFCLKELTAKKSIETIDVPVELNYPWAFLRQPEHDDRYDDMDYARYGSTLQQLYDQDEHFWIRITFEGVKELEIRKNWTQRNPILYGIITLAVGAILSWLLKK
jgi:hypothetical protein